MATKTATKDQRISARYILAVTSGDRQEPVSLRLDRNEAGCGQLGDDVVATQTDGVADVEIIPWASDIRWDRTPATRIRYPKDNVVVQRRGMRLRDVSLSGEIGPFPQRWPATKATTTLDAAGRLATTSTSAFRREAEFAQPERIAESVERLERIDKMLDQVAGDTALRLHLYAINEQAYWEVEPLRATGSRVRSFRTGWVYSFHFRILGEVQAPDVDAVRWAAPSFTETNPLKLALAAVRAAQDAVNTAIQWVRDGAAWLYGEFAAPILSMIDAAFETAESLTALAADVAGWVVGAAHLPVSLWNRMRLIGYQWRQIAKDLEWGLVGSWERAWGLGGGYGSAELDRLEDSSPMRDMIGSISDSIAATAAAELALLMAADDADGRTGWALVRPGDSLERLALRHLGDPERWPELQSLNRLLYPYVSSARAPQTVAPGDQIRIPLRYSGRRPYFPDLTGGPASKRLAKAARLGSDLSVTRRAGDQLFDWALKNGSTGESGRAGLALVDGVEAFSQNLTKRLETVLGTNPLFPGRGVPTAVGLLATTDRQAAYMVAVTQELRGDDRVAEVRDLAFTRSGAETGFEATIGLVEGSDVPTSHSSSRV